MKTFATALAGIGLMIGMACAAEAAVIFQDDFEGGLIGSYQSSSETSGIVVPAGAPHPASPAGGSSLGYIDRTVSPTKQVFFPAFTQEVTNGTVRVEFDALVTANNGYIQFGFTSSESGGTVIGGGPRWHTVHAIFREGLVTSGPSYQNDTPTGLTHTFGQWQHYAVEYTLGSTEITLYAGSDSATTDRFLFGAATSLASVNGFMFRTGSTTSAGYIDNVVVTIVPEPAAAGLMTLMFGGLWSRRRETR